MVRIAGGDRVNRTGLRQTQRIRTVKKICSEAIAYIGKGMTDCILDDRVGFGLNEVS